MKKVWMWTVVCVLTLTLSGCQAESGQTERVPEQDLETDSAADSETDSEADETNGQDNEKIAAESDAGTNGVWGQEDEEKIIELLSSYSNAMETERDNGQKVFIAYYQEEKIDMAPFYSFYEQIKAGNEDSLIVVHYTIEGDAVLTYLSYKNNEFYYMEDISRDKFAGSEEGYFGGVFPCLREFRVDGNKLYYLMENEEADYGQLSRSWESTEEEIIPSKYIVSIPAGEEEFEPSPYPAADTPAEVTMAAKDGSLDFGRCDFVIKNSNANEYSMGSRFVIEREINGNWYTLPVIINDVAWEGVLYLVRGAPGAGQTGETVMEIDWEYLYGRLNVDKNKYRIVKEVWLGQEFESKDIVTAEFGFGTDVIW